MTTPVRRFVSAVREGRLISAMQRRLSNGALHDDENDFLTKVRGVIHVGANDGSERYVYAEYGLKVIWIEPIPEVFQQLVENIRSFPDQKAINALITNVLFIS